MKMRMLTTDDEDWCSTERSVLKFWQTSDTVLGFSVKLLWTDYAKNMIEFQKYQPSFAAERVGEGEPGGAGGKGEQAH